MGERSLFGRARALLVVLSAFGALSAGCADGNTTTGGHRDTGTGEAGTMDAGVPDTGPRDSGALDSGAVDANNHDAGADTGPHTIVGTCEACTTDADCDPMSFCARLVTGEHACLPGCDSELPVCPRAFTCIFDATGTGVHANVCAPVGGPCCVDEDADTYGVGVGCMGPDCNDSLVSVHPGRDEICDGIDTNCNAHVDEDPNDCMTGRCSADGDGTYSAIAGATCRLAACTSGTNTDCGLYTCHDGAAMGTTCATQCLSAAGTDDDLYCIVSAHCDTGACVADVPSGGVCDEDSDCSSTHCDNGFCCGSGTCCATDANCPGGGSPTRICDDPTNCQGHRGVVTCQSNSCTAMSGINDDTACDASVTARDCGTYNPIVCTGADPQTSRACPTSCVSDADCVAAAHCAVGFCIPDLPQGGPCGRNADCQTGLSCVDSTCCSSACTGACMACNVAGSEGTCSAIAAGSDPAGECPGFACDNYYTGFGAGSDVCRSRAPVSDSAAACDGAGACRTAAVMCPAQLPGTTQIDCNDTCMTPRSGTCTGNTAGVCDNLDGTAGTRSCGSGACTTTVQACVMGLPQTCMAPMGGPESCNGVDDNCNGTVDDGGAALCGAVPHVDTQSCNGFSGCGIAMCSTGWANYDGSTGNGCECDLAGAGATCAVARNLGSVTAGMTMSQTVNIGPGASSAWFQVAFPADAAPAPRGGTPTISVTPSANFHIFVWSNCSAGTYACNAPGDPANSGTGSFSTYQMADTVANGPTGYTSAMSSWPATVYIQVVRNTPATTCANATFSLTVSR